MARPHRSGSLASVASALAGLLACAPGAPPLRTCATADECPAQARCVSSACVANAPPSAAVALPPAPLRTNVLLSFDASASADADAGDSVVAFAWAFRSVSAPCAPPTVAGAGPLATVRFACPGRYAVDVTATDELGAGSMATVELDVVPNSGAALLAAGDDVVVDHVCTPAPPRCTPAAPVALSASTPGIPLDQVSFAWTVEPPSDRALGAGRRVAFAPSATVAAPAVTLETDGVAISGDWVFRVEARDAAGVIGTAATRVSVLNRAPTVVETIPVPDHAFDGSHFTATGEVPFTATDPDGDPLLGHTVEWRHAGDGGSAFSGELLAAQSRVTFSIDVAYAVPEDAFRLIGGAGLERTVVFGVSDVNGARTVESWPILVGNRPPALVGEPPPTTVEHRYDAVALAYVAEVPLSAWSDPDGDPLSQVAGSDTGDPVCPDLVVSAGTAHALCRLAFAGTPAVANFAGPHTALQAIQDPWTPAADTSAVGFAISNRPPSFTSTAPHLVAEACTVSSVCCQSLGGECTRYSASVFAGSSTVPGRWADPDGDPLDVHVGASGSVTPVQPLVCTPSTCSLQLDLAPLTVCGPTTTSLATTITDGLDTASAGLPVVRGCE